VETTSVNERSIAARRCSNASTFRASAAACTNCSKAATLCPTETSKALIAASAFASAAAASMDCSNFAKRPSREPAVSRNAESKALSAASLFASELPMRSPMLCVRRSV